jgi:hypothetical protein
MVSPVSSHRSPPHPHSVPAQQRPFPDTPMAGDGGEVSLHPFQPSCFLHGEPQVEDLVSPTFDDRARRSLASPTSQSLAQPLPSAGHRHQLPRMGLCVLASDHDTNRPSQTSVLPTTPFISITGNQFPWRPSQKGRIFPTKEVCCYRKPNGEGSKVLQTPVTTDLEKSTAQLPPLQRPGGPVHQTRCKRTHSRNASF